MSLFYTALERATAGEAEAAEERPASAPAPAFVTTWKEAARLDLTGFPLADDAAPTEAEAAPAPPATKPTMGARARRWMWWRTATREEPAGDADVAREQYRILRTRVLEAMRNQGLSSLLVTSAGAGEGKTRVATELARQFSALRGGRVLLIDADLRRAGLSATLASTPAAGLTQYLKGEASLDALLWEVDPWLAILPTLRAEGEAPDLLASPRMEELLREAQERFDLVLLDGAPVGPVADSRILARLTGGSLLVVRAGTTTDAIEQAAALLRPRLLGSVLNAAQNLDRGKYGYRYAAKAAGGATPEGQP